MRGKTYKMRRGFKKDSDQPVRQQIPIKFVVVRMKKSQINPKVYNERTLLKVDVEVGLIYAFVGRIIDFVIHFCSLSR